MHSAGGLPIEQANGTGRVRVEALAPDVLLFVASGHLSIARARLMVDAAERRLAQVDRLHAFHDWEGVTGYDWLSRVELTRFLVVHRHRFASAHLLVADPAVAYGVEVANIVLKNKIAVHRERAGFDAALARLRSS